MRLVVGELLLLLLLRLIYGIVQQSAPAPGVD